MFLNFLSLKKITIKDKFPISIIDDILHELKGTQFFTKLDLHSSDHQIHMKDFDIPKLIFTLMNANMSSWR